jgi:glucosylceramidase
MSPCYGRDGYRNPAPMGTFLSSYPGDILMEFRHTETGELTYMSSYYYLGHFSKFIRPGAHRIISSSTADDLLTTAFLNPDGRVAVIVMNTSVTEQPFYLWVEDKAAETSSHPHSIMTLVF